MGAINAAIEDFVPVAERAAVAGQFFGEEGSIAMSRIDSATLCQATEDVRDFGAAVSEQDADRIEQTNDALSRLALIGRGLANRLTVALAPALKAAADGIAAISRTGGPVPRALEAMGRAASFVVDNFRLLASIAGSFVGFLVGRFVAGFVAAALGVRGLATMLVVLRGALIRTGIGALIVGAGFLVDFLIRLREATGSWGEALAELVASYRDTAPKLATWLEENVPEGLAVFTLPEHHHRRRLRTSNPMERAVQQELKRRTAKVRVFPSDDSLLRLVSAILVEIDEKWASDTKAYIKWNARMHDPLTAEFPDLRLLNPSNVTSGPLHRPTRGCRTVLRSKLVDLCYVLNVSLQRIRAGARVHWLDEQTAVLEATAI